MNTSPKLKRSCAAILVLMVSFSNSVEAQDEKSPASILAVDFPSIQAALDSLPASGGMVQLPPGTTEITEPLADHDSGNPNRR